MGEWSGGVGIYYYSFSNFYYFCSGFQYGGVGEWRGEGGFITTFSVIFTIFGVYSSTPVVKITENAVMQYYFFSNFYYFWSVLQYSGSKNY